MRLPSLLACVSASALLIACGIGAPAYPEFGDAAYSMTGTAAPSDGAAPVNTTIYRDGGKMRVETVMAGRGNVSIVHDSMSGESYIVTPAAAVSTVTPAPAAIPAAAPPAATPGAPAAVPAATAPAAVAVAPAAGTAVRIEDEDAPKPIEESWVSLGKANAKSLGPCTVAGEKGARWTPREATEGVARVACITADGIVLEVTESQTVIWRAASITRGPQDPALFGVPAGYQIVDPKALAASVGDALQDAGQVTGETKAPAATAPMPPTAPAPPKT